MIELAKKKRAFQQASSGDKLLKLKKKPKPTSSDMDSLKDQLSVSRPLSPSYNIKTIFCAGLHWEDVSLPQTWEGYSCGFQPCTTCPDKEMLFV